MIDERWSGLRKSRLLIPDNTPISLLGMIGVEALDWLFEPGAEVWVTDMVRAEALRDPDPGNDPRIRHRATIAEWFEKNRHRIQIQDTAEGEEYRKSMTAWQLAGSQPELKPSWRSRGEKSIIETLDNVSSILEDGEAVVVVIDDVRARAVLSAMFQLDIDLMATQSFIEWMQSPRFNVARIDTAWAAIRAATDDKVYEPKEDPIHIYRP